MYRYFDAYKSLKRSIIPESDKSISVESLVSFIHHYSHFKDLITNGETGEAKRQSGFILVSLVSFCEKLNVKKVKIKYKQKPINYRLGRILLLMNYAQVRKRRIVKSLKTFMELCIYNLGFSEEELFEAYKLALSTYK